MCCAIILKCYKRCVIRYKRCVTSRGSPPQLVFNLTVTLKDSKPKPPDASTAGRSRKEEQARHLADKLVGNFLIYFLIFVKINKFVKIFMIHYFILFIFVVRLV